MSLPVLEQVRVATPCHASWEEMKGDDQVRFCSQCSLNVYNLSEMKRGEAEAFIAKSEGRVCIRLYRRDDGTVITKDCPVGRRALHRQVLAIVGGVLAAMFMVGTGALASAGILSSNYGNPVASTIADWFRPSPPTPFMGSVAPQMGDMCIPEPPAETRPIPGSGEEQPDA